ncbi:hypothetical protein FHS57_000565 [Runella defluvii]|uniref:Uncharacterized protein n=1 Tax=Runella defluvii TaxID=370973 RepID=A0A7W5ZFV3_9BACT|nr:hypothetical protein [Runella defluvii]MBB3836583.1 hypothetical protein [Runella defluvii]
MRRHYFPSILLYGLGLTLALSLGFNGFLLYQQTRQRSLYEFELASVASSVDNVYCRQQLSECIRHNQEKDSLLRELVQHPNAPPLYKTNSHSKK